MPTFTSPPLAALGAPLRVKFLTKGKDRDVGPSWRKFLPGGGTRVGACEFIFDREATDYDWLVVYDDLPSVGGERFTRWQERLYCPRRHTLLMTTEPPTVKIYGAGFVQQFGWVLSSQEASILRHPQVIRQQVGLVRFYEGDQDQISQQIPWPKTDTFSTVCSSKQQKHTLHHARYAFTQRLKQALPELEIYGHGVRPMVQKNEALDAYKYHLAIENHRAPHHWTEKLGDAFLARCLPFYFGAPNAADYFPPESFIPIDIFNFEQSFLTIRAAIAEDAYNRRREAIETARHLLLNRWSTFVQLARLIEERHDPAQYKQASANSKLQLQSILSRHAYRQKHWGEALAVAWTKWRMRHFHPTARPVL